MRLWSVIDWAMRVSGILFILEIIMIFVAPVIPLAGIGILLGLTTPRQSSSLQLEVIPYSLIDTRRLTPEFIETILSDRTVVGDSLCQTINLKSADSSGYVWLGLNPENNTFLVLYDYFEDCSCGPNNFGLLRYNIDSLLNKKLIIDHKMSFADYFH